MYRRKQIAPVYLASHEKYRVDEGAVFNYDDAVEEISDIKLDQKDLDRLEIAKFRNKYDPVIGSWEDSDTNHAAFSWLITYKVTWPNAIRGPRTDKLVRGEDKNVMAVSGSLNVT